jgi:regulator of ribosome biosynthesis
MRCILLRTFCSADQEAYLAELAREGVQILLSKLFSLPVSSSPEGPLAQLPKPTTLLPRAKSLPKPKPLTKWEKFAAAKGINKQRKEKKIWDEERRDWVNRWGRDGKNKEKEEQWIQVLPDQARMFNHILPLIYHAVTIVFDPLFLLLPADDYNPAIAAKAARKQHVAKNEAQRQANLARAERSERKTALEKTLLTTKASTASMGR